MKIKRRNFKIDPKIKKEIKDSLKQMRKQPDYEDFGKLIKSLGKK